MRRFTGRAGDDPGRGRDPVGVPDAAGVHGATALKDQASSPTRRAAVSGVAADVQYEGAALPIYDVPIDGVMRELALVEKGREDAVIIDPANPGPGRSPGRGAGARSRRTRYFEPQGRQLRDRVGPDRVPEAVLQHGDHRGVSTIGAVGRRSAWPTASAGSASPAAGLFLLLLATIMLPSRSRSSRRTSCSCARLGRHVAAADRPALLRERLQRVPAAPVLPDDPDATSTRRR